MTASYYGAEPMTQTPDLKRDFFKVLLLPALTLFLLPGLTYGLAKLGERRIDEAVLESVQKNLAADKQLDEAQRAEELAFYKTNPPSLVCRNDDPQFDQYRSKVCARGDDLWQFIWASRLTLLCLGLGLFAIVGALALGFIAFLNRRAQYWSFMLGWRGLMVVTAVEVVVQGSLAVWASYWATALFFHSYVPKLILLVAAMALYAMFIALKAIFQRLPDAAPLDAELIREHEAPVLWRRLRTLATSLTTQPPENVIAGIDDNFFVTERDVQLASGAKLSGRTLYVSLPLLRLLETSEADAVFSHELAHFMGGDTEAGAKLGPMLARYSVYWEALYEGGITIPAAHVMRLFRVIFEFALQKEHRRRELLADATAVKLTSADDVARSLIKVIAYSNFRSETERKLFEVDEKHTAQLELKQRVETGLPEHVGSPHFMKALEVGLVPHPFDSHPPLQERIAAVNATVKLDQAASVLQTRPTQTWLGDVQAAHDIEARLWAQYESRFKQHHEESLAYRYLPATDEERALVEKFFPPISFDLKDGERVELNYERMVVPGKDGGTVMLATINDARIIDGTFSNHILVTYETTKQVKLQVKALGDHAQAFQNSFAGYWQRARAAQQFAAEANASSTTTP